jgi:outer membrane lipoprotein LolB
LSRQFFFVGLLSVLLLALTGCATQNSTTSELTVGSDFVRNGRFSLRAEAPNKAPEAVQGGFAWRDGNGRLTLDLNNPFGNILARVIVEPNQATLTQPNGDVLRATDPDGLVQKAIGQRVPVRDLRQWLRVPLRALPTMQQIKRDDQGRIVAFEQNGWTVEMTRFDAQGPRLLVLSRAESSQQIVIRLIVDTP